MSDKLLKIRNITLAVLVTVLLVSVCAFSAGCNVIRRDAAGQGNNGHSAQQAEEGASDPSDAAEPGNADGTDNSDPSDNSNYVLLEEVPEYSGDPYIEINGNKPEFTKKEIRKAKRAAIKKGKRFEVLSELDRLGRCGSVVAAVCRDTMPEDERGSIGMIKPSGWQFDKYDFIENGYLYNRCHMIGWQLTGLNDEERNLITGTRYMNTEGMLPFENRVAEYVMKTGEHVLYRVTPIFKGEELVARGVEMEALSLEDGGEGLSFNIYCYNVQPGVKINYKTGKSRLDKDSAQENDSSADGETDDQAGGKTDSQEDSQGQSSQADGRSNKTGDGQDGHEPQSYPELDIPDGVTYVINSNTMRFHRTDCKSARSIRKHNLVWFYGTRKEAVDAGYVPCGVCKP